MTLLIRVLLVNDDPLVLSGLKMMLALPEGKTGGHAEAGRQVS
jgi:hypothetical protein